MRFCRYWLAPLLAFSWLSSAHAETAIETAEERGRYLLSAAGCVVCHTKAKGGVPLAGGRPFKTPFGVFYSPNITPHPKFGIGGWRLEDFRDALREGVGPERDYYPVFPFTSFTRMSDDDIAAMWAYLRTVTAVAQSNEPHELSWYLVRPIATRVWKWFFFSAERFEPDPDKEERWNRGAYLVEALSHCGECHTPRWPWGASKQALALAGNPEGPEGGSVPNITPDRKTGIGKWSESDLVWYLQTGGTPDGDYAGGAMADVIDHVTSKLSDTDRAAIAHYLKTLEPIERRVVNTESPQR